MAIGAVAHQPAHGVGIERVFPIHFTEHREHDGGGARVGVPVPAVFALFFPVGAGGRGDRLAGEVGQQGLHPAVALVDAVQGVRQEGLRVDVQALALVIELDGAADICGAAAGQHIQDESLAVEQGRVFQPADRLDLQAQEVQVAVQHILVDAVAGLFGLYQPQGHVGADQRVALLGAPPAPAAIRVLQAVQALQGGIYLLLQAGRQLGVVDPGGAHGLGG